MHLPESQNFLVNFGSIYVGRANQVGCKEALGAGHREVVNLRANFGVSRVLSVRRALIVHAQSD